MLTFFNPKHLSWYKLDDPGGLIIKKSRNEQRDTMFLWTGSNSPAGFLIFIIINHGNCLIPLTQSNMLSPPLRWVKWSRLTQRIDKWRNAEACSKARARERPRDQRASVNDQRAVNAAREHAHCSRAHRSKSRPARREAFLPMRQRNCWFFTYAVGSTKFRVDQQGKEWRSWHWNRQLWRRTRLHKRIPRVRS